MTRVPFTDWRAVASLSESTQRDLISTGDPTERVWAIWALGLSLGRGSLSDLNRNLDREPIPGIRCQLVVVLAGLGQRDLVRQIALEDPDPAVRATAAKYVVRTLPLASEAALEFALERMRRDVPRVQHAMFEEAQSGRLRLPDGALVTFLAHADLETRQLALESVRSLPRPSDDMISALADRALGEPDAVLRRACVDLYLRHGVAARLLDLARSAAAPVACEVLSALQRAGIQSTWNEVVALARRSDAEISLAVLGCLAEPLEPDAIRWMSNVTAASLAIPSIGQASVSTLQRFQWQALARLYKALAPETVSLFDRSVAQVLLDGLIEEDEYRDDGPDEEINAANPEAALKRELLEKRCS